ncbi:MAG: twin-arginine translocation signal domain-containing protein [Myxococcota bacterium]|nr:twin-arginine translocation signal domain-containing protein [Myxococcota bacterium]
MTGPCDRRQFLRGAATAAASLGLGLPGCREGLPAFAEPGGWSAGRVAHLLPSASDDRILLKLSLREPAEAAPVLEVGERAATGERTDSAGRFYAFDARGLEPGTRYELRLRGADGAALCDPWTLRTLPHPDAEPERLRLLCYTCAGGPELTMPVTGTRAFLPIAWRRRLLARALSFEPDLAIANGDHVYWDQRGRAGRWFGGPLGWWLAGRFDREQPVLGTANEAVLERAVDPQIAELYGTLLRSVPVVFLRDDHDYTENDEASEALRTFPADAFMRSAAAATQHLYYPELLADTTLPAAHRGANDRAASYGRVRYGRLFEALLYDCRGGLANAADPGHGGAGSWFVPPEIERWLLGRTARSAARHLVHMPSTPVLWSAGKWGEWYPDAKDADGVLTAEAGKPFWPRGWKDQHDRLLAAVAARSDRIPLFVSGDLHATGLGAITANEGAAVGPRPVVSLLCGTLGTSDRGWPSAFRGQRPLPSGTLSVEEWIEPLEENGFSILDITPDAIAISLFRWTPAQGPEAIDTLEPFAVHTLARSRSEIG